MLMKVVKEHISKILARAEITKSTLRLSVKKRKEVVLYWNKPLVHLSSKSLYVTFIIIVIISELVKLFIFHHFPIMPNNVFIIFNHISYILQWFSYSIISTSSSNLTPFSSIYHLIHFWIIHISNENASYFQIVL